MSFLKLEQKISYLRILIAALIGIYVHILLDAPIYTDIMPFFPVDLNPFFSYNFRPGELIRAICSYCFLGAFFVYLAIIIMNRKSKLEENDPNGYANFKKAF
jgi:hypothetical protein